MGPRVVLTLLLTAGVGCTSQPADELPSRVPEFLQAIRPIVSQALMQISSQMTRSQLMDGENVLMCPLSTGATLALLLAGSRGQTRQQLLRVFGFEEGDNFEETMQGVIGELFDFLNSEQTIYASTGVFYQRGEELNEDFHRLAKEVYRSDIRQLPFKEEPLETARAINKWVSEHTKGKIQKLVEDLKPKTSAFIANTIYFNASWAEPFDESRTKLEDFYVSENETVAVKMMSGEPGLVFYHKDEENGAQVVGLPYSDLDTVFYMVLPPPGTGLATYLDSLQPVDLQELIDRAYEQEVSVKLPRLETDEPLDLERQLTSLDVSAPYDFTGLGRGLQLSSLVQRAVLGVSERGSEGGGVIAASFSSRAERPLVQVNRPFLYLIRHVPTGAVFFWGAVFRPASDLPNDIPL